MEGMLLKKLFIVCFLLLVSIPLYGYASINVSGVYLKDAMEKHDIILDFQNPSLKKVVGNIILLPDEPYDKKIAGDMIVRLASIHPNILKALSNAGVKIKLFEGKLTDEPAFSHLKGVQPKGWSEGKTWDDVPGAGGTVIAAAKIGASEKGQGHGSINLELHEIAHSADNKIFNSLRNNEIFLKIWKTEVHSLFPNKDYFINFPEEYFAEAFAMYYYNDETKGKLKQAAPKTYEFIKSLEMNVNQVNVSTHR